MKLMVLLTKVPRGWYWQADEVVARTMRLEAPAMITGNVQIPVVGSDVGVNVYCC